jgi:hypothetical protein
MLLRKKLSKGKAMAKKIILCLVLSILCGMSSSALADDGYKLLENCKADLPPKNWSRLYVSILDQTKGVKL